MRRTKGLNLNSAAEAVDRLATELTRIRLRGIDRIDFESHNQSRLMLNAFDDLVVGSPWRNLDRSVAIRRLLTVAVDHCHSGMIRRAALALFGLGEYIDLDTGARLKTGLEELKVSPAAAPETRKAQIRNLRNELARGILKAEANGWRSPEKDTDWEFSDDFELAEEARRVFGELRSLCEGRGISPGRLARSAPAILALPGSQDEFRRDAGATDPANGALKFLSCTVNSEPMKKKHHGPLVSYLLNLRHSGDLYDARVAKYVKAAEVEEGADLERLMRRAFARFSRLLVSLEKSPCQDQQERLEENQRIAEGFFLTMKRMDHDDQREVLINLGNMFREEMPEVDRLFPELNVFIFPNERLWLGRVVFKYIEQYEIWVHQYRERIEPDQLFLDPGLFGDYLLLPPSGDYVAEMSKEYAQQHWKFTAKDDPAKSRPTKPPFDVEREFELARDASLALTFQMLTYNHNNQYWEQGLKISLATNPTQVPQFPMVRIDDLISDRARVPN